MIAPRLIRGRVAPPSPSPRRFALPHAVLCVNRYGARVRLVAFVDAESATGPVPCAELRPVDDVPRLRASETQRVPLATFWGEFTLVRS